MIDALENGDYILVGEDRPHRFLQDLVDFHRRSPIMPFTEVLTVACGQVRKCLCYPTCVPELNSQSVYYIDVYVVVGFVIHLRYNTLALRCLLCIMHSKRKLSLCFFNNTIFVYLLTTFTLCKNKNKNDHVLSVSLSGRILCKSSNEKSDYAELLFPQRRPQPNTSMQHNSLQLNVSPPQPPEEFIPPPRPSRPDKPRNSAVLVPSSEQNYPYSCLQFPHNQLPAMVRCWA